MLPVPQHMAKGRHPALVHFWPLAAAFIPSQAQVAAAGGSAAPPLCEGCFDEPAEVEYFGGTPGGEPRRLRGDASREEFEQAVLSGQVLIIENATAGAAMEGWTCTQMAKEFPEGRMRREYDWVKNGEDRNLQSVGSQAWIDAQEAGEDAAERLQQDDKAPPFAPFYWGIREHRGGDVGNKKVLARMKKLIAKSVPSFMDPANAESMFDNAEFWLGARGTGARAHMDSHCISTLSMVLSGERRWRIGPVPRMPKGAGRSSDGSVVFDDGVAYKLGWRPMFEFVVKAGEAILFPPGWIHETLNTAEGCTVALTTQFTKPYPIRYYRSFYQRLRRVGDLNPCWRDMVAWGSAGERSSKGRPAVPKAAKASEQAEKVWSRKQQSLTGPEKIFFDANADGEVSHDEFVMSYAAWAATETAVRREKQVVMPRPDMSWGTGFPPTAGGRSTEL